MKINKAGMATKNEGSGNFNQQKLWNIIVLISVNFWTLFNIAESAVPCAARNYGRGSIVCVCNATYCDSLDTLSVTPPGMITVYESNKNGARFRKTVLNFTSEDDTNKLQSNLFSTQTIVINRDKQYQEIFGFGGAFTDAASINILSMPENLQDKIMQSYFSKEGLEYSMGRVPLASTDFSTHKYSYADDDGDFELKNFSLTTEDTKFKIPLIQAAEKIRGKPLTLFGSPWSAPAWMKTNNDMAGRGQLKGKPGDKYHKTWAEYFVKFLKAYEDFNITFWGLTVQNEPIDGFIPYFPFQAMGFTPSMQRDFVKYDLGPALWKAGYTNDKIKLMILDDQRFFVSWWADTILGDAEASKYVSGIAFHWYFNTLSPVRMLDRTHENYPNVFLISTEACAGANILEIEKVSLGNWHRAEEYAHDIMEDLLHWTTAWIDWNLVLDLQGGPNWVKNFVDSPIIVNQTGQEFYKQPMYYALGHFSKFLPPGSKRIDHSISGNGVAEIGAFSRPDGGTVVIAVNRRGYDAALKIVDPKMGMAMKTVPAHSIQSYVWWPRS